MSQFDHNIPGYELIRELGQGGMATVFLAIQRSLDRKVAIKVMKRNIDDLDKFERRFLMEGRTMAKLPHRNIVAVYDIVKGEDVTYIAMEYLDGGTLSGKMKEGLSLAEAISVVVQIGQALQFAHEHGIVHRDLKPANIMFRDSSTPVLTDFGIAKHQDAAATRLTQTGMLVGTPTYMSPEQINALEVDGRSDLYSLGIMFYELLTGSPPFHADTPIAVLMAHLTTPPPNLPEAFADFQPVMDRMLAKNRDDRFPNLKDMTRALKGAVVNNQNLWARLQADPNQSSSEQLRALGFSVSGGVDSGPSTTGEIRLPPSKKGQARTPSPVSLQVPGETSQVAIPSAKKTPWIAIGAGGLVLAAVIAGAVIFWPKPGLDPAVQKLVDVSLIQVDQEIAKKDLLTALSTMRSALELAPEYEGTKQRVEKLVNAFKGEAKTAIAANDFDTALAKLEQAKLVDDKDPELRTLSEQIASQRVAAESAKEIADLLARADRAANDRAAYAVLSEARTRAPNDPKVKQRLDALLDRVLKPAKQQIAAGDLTNARAVISGAESYLANEPAWQQLRSQLDVAIETQNKRLRMAQQLAKIDEQIRANKLVQPAGDNAQESLAQLLLTDAKDPEVVKRQVQLASAFASQAQASLNAGRFEEALTGAELALNIKPDFAQANTIKTTALSRLDAGKAKIIGLLSNANQAIAAQQFVSPPGKNAKALAEEVLKLDPRNVEAQSILQVLPQRIADAARQHVTEGDLKGAGTLVAEGLKAYPSDAALAALGQEVNRQVAAAEATKKRTEQLDRISKALAMRPIKAETIGTAARDIAALLKVNAGDVDAATQKQRLFDTLSEGLRSAGSPADVDVIAAALKQAQVQFANDPDAQRVAAELSPIRERLVQEEQARLAALQGELVINAYPWATVEQVLDKNKKPVALPADKTTPLKLTLPQGVYYVTFKHPSVGKTQQGVANVQAKKTVPVSVSFATGVSSKDYLKRAGW